MCSNESTDTHVDKFYEDIWNKISKTKEVHGNAGLELFIFSPMYQDILFIEHKNNFNLLRSHTEALNVMIKRGHEIKSEAITSYQSNKHMRAISFDEHVLRGVIPLKTNDTYMDVRDYSPVCVDEIDVFSDDCEIKFHVGAIDYKIRFWQYLLLVGLVHDVGQDEPVQEMVIISMLQIFELDYYTPSTTLVAWNEFDSVIARITTLLYFQSDVMKQSPNTLEKTGCFVGIVVVMLFYYLTKTFANQIPDIHTPFMSNHPMPWTCKICSSFSVIILIWSAVVYYYNEKRQTKSMLDVDTNTHKLEAIDVILKTLLEIQDDEFWMRHPNVNLHNNIKISLKCVPSIMTRYVLSVENTCYFYLKALSMMLLLVSFWVIMMLFPTAPHDSMPHVGFFLILYILTMKPDVTKLRTLLAMVPNMCMLAWPRNHVIEHGQSSLVLDYVTVACIYAVHYQALIVLYRDWDLECIVFNLGAWGALVYITLANNYTIVDFGLAFLMFMMYSPDHRTAVEKKFDNYLRSLATKTDSNSRQHVQ